MKTSKTLLLLLVPFLYNSCYSYYDFNGNMGLVDLPFIILEIILEETLFNNNSIDSNNVYQENIGETSGYVYRPSEEHKQLVIQKIRTYLSENIVFPKNVSPVDVEGQAVMFVSIAPSGKIRSFKVVKSNSDIMKEGILRAMRSLKAIDLKGERYKGIPRLHVIINLVNSDTK